MESTLALTTGPDAHDQRLDRWLADALPERSRTEIQRWIKEGRVQVAGDLAKANTRLNEGQSVAVALPDTPAPAQFVGEALPLTIIYEDKDMLVIDKLAGMVVHPAPGHSGGTLVNAVLHHCPDIAGVGGEQRPGIVHRLDKETSGLIVVAKNDQAHRNLQAQFKARTVYKEYLALLEGRLQPDNGRISAPIGRHPTDRKRMGIQAPGADSTTREGREAVTEYHVVGIYTSPVYGRSSSQATFTLVKAILHTGRTHQIRVHFAWLRHPVVGDTVYGFRTPRLPLKRQFLHAHRMRLRIPSTGEVKEFVAPLPEDLKSLLAMLAS